MPSRPQNSPLTWIRTSTSSSKFPSRETIILTCRLHSSMAMSRSRVWGTWLAAKCSFGSARWTGSLESALLSTMVMRIWLSPRSQSKVSGTRPCGTSSLSTWWSPVLLLQASPWSWNLCALSWRRRWDLRSLQAKSPRSIRSKTKITELQLLIYLSQSRKHLGVLGFWGFGVFMDFLDFFLIF